ncbi:eIF-2-alpha kinase GCN2 isoform X2 [Bacillus rossius redtenbacheri]|uniref:eIF-2-alpha kinase GCN2 isoform X2 n=1 Tax=Bacillus rossius redtenbacheri TaxID=93214 RepID=UPI002FDE933D
MAIFSHDLRDVRKRAWSVWSPTDIVITLTPQQGSSGCREVHATIDLHITCSEKYPDEPPTILLERSKGLSSEKVSQLSTELRTLAQQLVGEVMVFELAQHVQKFLHIHNKPGFKSFYEEMVLRQQELHHKQQLVRKQQEDMQRQVILGEIMRKQEVLREEKQERRRESSRHRSRDRDQTVSESSESSCDLISPQVIRFNNRNEREVCRGKCLGHSVDGSAVHSGFDVQSGELFALITWTFRGDLASIFKQLSSIDQELNYLQRLQHSNLVRYLNMTYSQNQDAIIVHLLQEFVHGTSLSFYIVNHMPMDIEILRFSVSGILAALSFLHKNNVVHKNLRASSVFLEKSGKVVVTDYSIDRRLQDISQADSGCGVSSGRWTKKTDIHQLGLLALSLLRGETLAGPLELEIPPSLPADCKDFLHRCLVRDEDQKWSAGQLLGHSFFKPSVQHGNGSKKKNSQSKQDDEEEDLDAEPIPALPANSHGHSRIHSDFEVLKSLGQGAFGSVLKVRNKLDGGVYAIKRIKLNPQNKQLNRKITREVKLLSRLNHENVVRYFNSWIESINVDSVLSASESVASSCAVPQKFDGKLMTASSDVEKLAPPMREVSVKWNLSHRSLASGINSESSCSDDSSDDDDYMGFLANRSSSEGVVFTYDGSHCIASNTAGSDQFASHNGAVSEKRPVCDEVQFMYIQMEFCEKSTLRTAIDSGLCEDEVRVWRLFREVVEGLAHIHQQGMIHRDLKPVNIFLDSNDHVKIGDFGLATTYILPRAAAASAFSEHAAVDRRLAEPGSVSELLDGSLTGQVGTALYVAPELSAAGFKTLYNQKVDIYSLGIIFFEMCFAPLETGMERVKVLANLRHPDIILPSNFSDQRMQRQVHIIRWLLNHDPALRPTSQELLQSSFLPPPQLEEASLQEMVRHTLSNPQSKAYKYLVGSCFKQEMGPAEDITYHMSLVRGPSPCMQELAKQTVARVFHKHGAVSLPTPLLSPPNQSYEAADSCVRLMARSGVIVCLPHDLRVPFARYVAWNGITFLKRYTVERVYREKKVFGFHPRELYECAFDIVTPTAGSLVADAELLSVVGEVVNEFPSLRDKACSIRLNHTALLRATLLHCGVDPDVLPNVCAILEEAKDERQSKFRGQLHVSGTSLSDQSIATLFGLIDTEGSLPEVSAAFRIVMKRRGEAASLAKQAFHELEAIISHAEALGVTWPISIAPGLVYNSHQYSGMMCQFVCELKKKRRKGGMDVLAAGGRYDSMLHTFRKTVELAGMVPREVSQSAAGVSISLDRIVSALQACDQDARALDVVVCSLGHGPMIKEKCAVVRELWAAGVRANLLDAIQSLEEVQDWCREMMVSNIVLLKETEATSVRVRSWDKERERFQEKRVATADLVDFLQRTLEVGDVSLSLTRSDSKTSTNCEPAPTQSVNVNFVLDERINAVQRRRVENQVISQLTSTLQRLSSRVRVEVLVLSVDSVVIKTLVSHLDLDADTTDFQKSIGLIIERHPRHKKYLSRVCDEIQDLCCQKARPVLVLYSREDNIFKIIL